MRLITGEEPFIKDRTYKPYQTQNRDNKKENVEVKKRKIGCQEESVPERRERKRLVIS